MNRASETQWFNNSFESQGNNLLLFCFPCACGDMWMFKNWPRALAGTAEVHPVSLPGRGPRIAEAPIASLKLLVQQLVPLFAALEDRPFGLFGHSMGAFIAFELAHELQRGGAHKPSLLVVASQRAPHRTKTPTLRFYELPDPILKSVTQRNFPQIERLDEPELSNVLLPLIRADFTLSQDYRYEPECPLGCPLVVFGGIEDSVSKSDLEAWRLHTHDRFELQVLPGDHFFLYTHEELFLERLRIAIRNVSCPVLL